MLSLFQLALQVLDGVPQDPQHRPRAAEVAKALAQVAEETHNPGSLMDSGSFAHQTLAEVS